MKRILILLFFKCLMALTKKGKDVYITHDRNIIGNSGEIIRFRMVVLDLFLYVHADTLFYLIKKIVGQMMKTQVYVIITLMKKVIN